MPTSVSEQKSPKDSETFVLHSVCCHRTLVLALPQSVEDVYGCCTRGIVCWGGRYCSSRVYVCAATYRPPDFMSSRLHSVSQQPVKSRVFIAPRLMGP